MRAVRSLLRRRPLLAALIVAAALALRVLVPGGFMPVMSHGRVVMQICSGAPDGPAAMAMPGMDHRRDAGGAATGKCAFSDLAQALTHGADPVQLAAALAFVLMLALAVIPPRPRRETRRLRPPLRGPPRPA